MLVAVGTAARQRGVPTSFRHGRVGGRNAYPSSSIAAVEQLSVSVLVLLCGRHRRADAAIAGSAAGAGGTAGAVTTGWSSAARDPARSDAAGSNAEHAAAWAAARGRAASTGANGARARADARHRPGP
jgi:hypothetical protein